MSNNDKSNHEPKLDPRILAQFTGTERWPVTGLRDLSHTPMVFAVADTAGAYWLGGYHRVGAGL